MNPSTRWTIVGAATVLFIAVLLLAEFAEPSQTGWNMLLGLMLAGGLTAAFFLTRFFRANIGEIGEARFDTHNPDRPNG